MTPSLATFETPAAPDLSTVTSICFALDQCAYGTLLLAATDNGICALLLGDQTELLLGDLHRRFPGARFTQAAKGENGFSTLRLQVLRLMDTPSPAVDLPLDLRGTPFQQSVWRALREIPMGSTATYRQIAEKIGRPAAIRAVAQACGANPVAVLVPCHRVVGSDGGLCGYRWGVERKRALLQREAEVALLHRQPAG